MEIVLNLVWCLVAVAGLLFWLRTDACTGVEKRKRLIALGMLLILLFPVISISDDLWAVQSLAEADSALRRFSDVNHSHLVLPRTPMLVALSAGAAQKSSNLGFIRKSEDSGATLRVLSRETAADRAPPSA